MTRPFSLLRRFVLLSAAATAFSACSGSSLTQIEPGKTFLLGGEQSAPLRVEGRNVGPVPVDILMAKDGVTTPVATVAPGSLFSKTFGAREVVMLRNPSKEQQARVAVEFNRDVSRLSMRYQDNEGK
jgi:hypothetical protein